MENKPDYILESIIIILYYVTLEAFYIILCGDEMWHELGKLELESWKKAVETIPPENESGGLFQFYRLVKTSPSPEQYVTANISLDTSFFLFTHLSPLVTVNKFFLIYVPIMF